MVTLSRIGFWSRCLALVFGLVGTRRTDLTWFCIVVCNDWVLGSASGALLVVTWFCPIHRLDEPIGTFAEKGRAALVLHCLSNVSDGVHVDLHCN